MSHYPTTAQMRVLAAIAVLGPCTTVEVQEAASIGKSAAHKHLVNLLGDGYIEGSRMETPNGRPPFVFSLTVTGREVIEQMKVDPRSSVRSAIDTSSARRSGATHNRRPGTSKRGRAISANSH